MKKLNRRAFTLIELLAVILILGIIALIAIPTVTSIIEDSKMQSYVRSAEGLLSSVDTKINVDMLKGFDINAAYNFKNNKLLNGELDIKGNLPKEGKIRVNNNGEAMVAVIYDNYCITKSFDDDTLTANVLENAGCNLPGNNSILKAYATYDGNEHTWDNGEEIYYSSEYRNNIVSINFLYGNVIPNNAIKSWDVSNAQDESIMAYIMPNGTKYDLYITSENNIYANKNSRALFKNFSELKTINFYNFDTSQMDSMYNMYYNCTNLIVLDLSGFNTSNVEGMNFVFQECSNLNDINLSSFDTSKTNTMQAMFEGCASLSKLDLINFDTNNVGNMIHMFYDCTNLTTINVGSKWQTSSSSGSMLKNCGTDELTVIE